MTIPVQWKGIYVTNERKMYIKRPSNFWFHNITIKFQLWDEGKLCDFPYLKLLLQAGTIQRYSI